MSDVNVVVLGGRIVRDAVLKTVGQSSLCEFSIASNRKYGEKEDTAFIDVDLWGKGAEGLSQHLVKGKHVVITGRLKQDTWETEEGRRSKVILVADRVDFSPTNKSEKSEQPSNNQTDDSGEDTDVPF